MDLKFSVVLLLGFCVVVKSQDAPSDCEIEVDKIWVRKVINADVDNNATDTKWSYVAKNIKDIKILNEKYVSVEFQNNKLTFKLKPDFRNYVEQETSSRIDNKLFFACEHGPPYDDITFVLDVKETFNHKPEFQGAPYNYLLPMPLSAGQDLLVTIAAKDIDLKNRKLNFEVIGEYAGIFEFTESIKNGKEYTTHLKTKTAFEIFENFDIQIQVTDDHSTEPKKSMETIKIEIDKQHSVMPIPIFEKPLYQEKYGINTVVTTHLVHTQLEPKETKIDEAYRDYFSIKVEGNSIIITPTKELSSDLLNEKNYVIFILETNYDGLKSPGKTVILLDIEAKPVTTTTTEQPTACPTFPPTTTETIVTTTCEPCPTTIEPTTTVCPTAPPCDCTTTQESTLSTSSDTTTVCPTIPTCPPSDCTTSEGTTLSTTPSSTSSDVSTICPPVTTCPTPTLPDCTTLSTISSSTSSDGTTVCPPANDTCVCPPDGSTSTTPIWTTSVCEPCPSTCAPDTTTPSGETSSTCPPCECNISTCEPIIPTTTERPADYVKYKNKKYNYEKATDYLGNLSEIKAESTIAEQIIYTIKDTSNDNVLKPNLEYSSVGLLTIHSKIDPGSYSITLQAKGVTTKTVDTAKVLLNINSVSECNGKSYFPNSLIVKELEENKESIVFSEIDDHSFEITGDNQNGWFTIKDKGLWINKVDREDELISSMYMSQIKTMIQITSGTTYTPARNSGLALINSWQPNDDTNIYGPCFYTSSIEYNTKRMTVVVIIKDINDNPPVFEMSNPFIIGYPNKNLAEFIAPPYLVQLKASDKDIGYNALIKYSTDSSKFTVDPHTGIVYPGKNTFKEDEDIDFTIAATDQDGNGQKTVLDVKVKILKEEYLSTVVVKNVLYTDLDAFVSKISKETGKTVRYITSTGMFETKDDTSAEKNYMYKSDEKIPVLKIIMYALDTNGEPIPSKEFKNLIEESVSEIETEQYKPPFDSNHSGSDESDNKHSGWIAAVSTLSVLLALVIIGVLVGYIVLIRPKMIASRPSHSYTKHDTRNSVHNAPVEEKLESSISTRRPTGFPPNFNASDLDTAEIENEKEVSDSESEEEKNQSDSSSDVGSTGRRKSMVKFDKNVTEIEIDEF